MEEFYPICVVSAVPNGDGIRFLHPSRQYDISSQYAKVVWSLLSLCSGYEDSKVIIREVHKKFKEYDQQILLAILGDLRSIGVVVDSREISDHFHPLTSNPMRYSHKMTTEEIITYAASARLPVAKGTPVSTKVRDGKLSELGQKRVSCRKFSDEPVSLESLQSILSTCYSVSNKPTPSAGELYPLKIYTVVLKEADNLPIGYYEWDPEREELLRFADSVDKSQLEYAFDSEKVLYGAAVVIVIAADMHRHRGKYSNRGYRYTILEAGHAAQMIVLSATENELGSLEYGGFLDDVVATELAMDFPRVSPIITVAIGHPSLSSDESQAATLEKLKTSLVGRNKPIRRVGIFSGLSPENGDSFYAAEVLYGPSSEKDARRSYRQRFSGGTASTTALAQIKAIAEGYERFCSGIVKVDKVARATELDVPWLDPREIAPLSPEQLANAPYLQAFDPYQRWEWIEGYNATTRTKVLVPTDLVLYPLRTETFGRKLCHEASSSGVAAYWNAQEATVRAALELVERDAVMRNWYSRVPAPRVELGLLQPHLQRRAQYWESTGREVFVLDHSQYGVAVANVLIMHTEEFPCFVNGSASSIVSYDEAVSKAFHEAELGLLHALKQKNPRRINPENIVHPMDHARFYGFPENLKHLAWLWEGHFKAPVAPTASTSELLDNLSAIVVHLSPQGSPLEVVRVLSKKTVPVVFGYGMGCHDHPELAGRVHPESISIPHYFA